VRGKGDGPITGGNRRGKIVLYLTSANKENGVHLTGEFTEGTAAILRKVVLAGDRFGGTVNGEGHHYPEER